jgi:MinD-like ATPase involved in chromosome partitioning or flagellar assembly
MTPNEQDNPTTAHRPEERANGVAAGPVPPFPGGTPDVGGEADAVGEPDSGAPDDGQFDDYMTSGANPFSSAYPPGTGQFRRLVPREFPQDETPPELPVMEQLPDPNALPDPGYPVMPGYQAFPPVASAFPPAVPPASAESLPSASIWPSPASWSPAPSELYPQPPDPDLDNSAADSPYQAPRAPAEAPPLHGPAVPRSDVQPATRPEEAPPLTAGQSSYTAAPPASSIPPAPLGTGPRGAGYAVGREPLSAPPALQEPATAEPPVRETADSLTADVLLHAKRAAPGVGWRRTVYRASGGLIRIGESAANLRHRDLVNRVRTPVAGGHHRVAVMSLKGGVGKTTAAVGLGSTLASLRGDRVIAVDGNPDRGTLSDKVRLETSATIRDLLNERAQVSRYADVRAFTSQSSSRLEILASDRDPGVSVAFSADDYRAVARVLEHYYSICITDCGTGLLHSAMAGILELADQIVLVSSPSVDGARSASATLDWLEAHDYGDLVRNGVVVLSTIRPRSKSTVDLDRLEQHFAARCRAVVRIPYDPHLEEGAEVELELLNSETADAYLNLAAIVGDGFAVPRRPVSRITRTAPLA